MSLVTNPLVADAFQSIGIPLIYQDGTLFQLDAQRVYRLARGLIKVVHVHPDGTHTFKYVIKRGDVFGSLAFLLRGNDVYPEHGLTVGLVELASLTQDEAHRLSETDARFRSCLYDAIGKRIVRLEKRMDAMMLDTAEARVVHFLMDYLEAQGVREDGKLVAPNLLTHREISTVTATARQTVTRVFNALRQKGYIDYDSNRLVQLAPLRYDGL